jgi:hypothetical protein
MGHAFNETFEFEDENQLEEYLSTIDSTNAIRLLELGFEMANRWGVFKTIDSHIIYLCMKKLKENEANRICCDDNNRSSDR